MKNLLLSRYLYCDSGICGTLGEDMVPQFHTLEHAYLTPNGYLPKIPNGSYECVRGLHRLNGMKTSFETFEIKGIPGRSGLLFHWGNTNADSSGCILLGDVMKNLPQGQFLTDSRKSFSEFMMLSKGINKFELDIK